MNIYAIIPLISVIGYITLIGIVLNRPLARVHKVFILYLVAAMLTSLCSSVLHADFFPAQTLLWNRALLVLVGSVPVFYYHFIRTFFNKPAGKMTYVGYTALIALAIFVSLGGMLKSSYVVDGILYHTFDNTFYALVPFEALFQLTAVFHLVQGIRSATNPQDRNRLGYLLTAAGLWMVFMATNLSPALANYSVDHIGNIASALIISYAILRYQLLNIRLVARRGLTYFALVACLAGIYIGSIFLAQAFFPTQPTYSIVLLATVLVLLLALVTRPLRRAIQEGVDRFFYKETYEHRQTLLSFNSRMGSIINLNELAGEILPTISKALRITQAKLLFQDNSSGDFTTQFTYPEAEGELSDEFRFNTDSPIVTWLVKDNDPLDLNQIDSIPEFKGLWQSEKEQTTVSNLGLLCPIKSRGKLVGILALGRKQSDTIYTHDDIELVMSIASQAGIIIANAQLYSQALVRANTDGLTGLYNHRHFHERLEQEIARGSRFGTTFSLAMLDIDLFKAYNDIYGHLAGDEALRKIGKYIENSIRSVDMAFRYGGEEFTILLPETQLEDAYIVAERIRKTVESQTSSMSMPITISLGIANWPIDGVMRQEIIACADAALYHAKQTGRNRTCLSSDMVKPETPLIGIELEARPRALSIIYALAATVDAKDHYTYGHSKKVSDYSVAIAEVLGLPQDRIATLRAASLLHDIGKVGIPDSILGKKGHLTDEEWGAVRAHPKVGVEIIRRVIDLVNCLPGILHHHERYDGKGYPSGLKGETIPLEARILAVADAYDAITSPRPYHEQLSPQHALTELKRCAGTQFDAEIVDAFCKIIEPTVPKELEVK